MFDEILKMVKDQLTEHPDVAALPAEQQEALHNEIANHVANAATNAPAPETNSGGILGNLENALASGGTLTSAIEGGIINSLASRFGLPPSVTGAISGALPGLLQKFVSKNNPSQENTN